MTEYKSPEQLGSIAIHQLNQELRQLFDECKAVEQAYNTASAIHKAIEKQRIVVKEQNLLNDIGQKKAEEEVFVGVRRN